MKRFELDCTMELSETGPWVPWSEVERLREALQWYADPENTAWQKDGFGGSTSNVMDDGGEVARAALAGVDHD